AGFPLPDCAGGLWNQSRAADRSPIADRLDRSAYWRSGRAVSVVLVGFAFWRGDRLHFRSASHCRGQLRPHSRSASTKVIVHESPGFFAVAAIIALSSRKCIGQIIPGFGIHTISLATSRKANAAPASSSPSPA